MRVYDSQRHCTILAPAPPTHLLTAAPPPPLTLLCYTLCPQVRNERALESLRDELEELEEQLQDSISASIKGKQVGHGGGG